MTDQVDNPTPALVRKFRAAHIAGVRSSLSPDAADALAQYLEALDDQLVTSKKLCDLRQDLIEKQWALIRSLVWVVGIAAAAGLVVGLVAAGAIG